MSKSKLLFNLPRPTVPVIARRSARSAQRAGQVDDATCWAIRRIYCVGRNYREHALEMGGDPDREPPFFFQKPADAVVVCNPGATTRVPYPPMTSSLHFEGELIVAIKKDGLRIPVKTGAEKFSRRWIWIRISNFAGFPRESQITLLLNFSAPVLVDSAMDHVYGYSVGCDLTRRDMQSEAKKVGRPWDAAKGFDHSCPVSPIIAKEDVELNAANTIQLKVNEETRQQSTIGHMIYSIPEIISNLSQLFRLRQGDLIMTGTPAGVAEVNVGDRVSITCGDLISCEFVMGEPE